MSCLPRLLTAGALCLLATGGVQAATVTGVEIRGLNELMAANVRVSLSLVEAIGKDVSGRRLGYLIREAEDETREALEPFGYYSPSINVERIRSGAGDQATVAAVITVDLGTPVTVRRSNLAIEGAGGKDKYLRADLAAFKPQPGDPLNHTLYEASKIRITRRLAERGYFDADFVSRKVEVTRAEHAADIDLVWTSGERYDMGPTTITQTPRIIREGILDRLVYWEEGSYYHQGKLDRLRESLARLDYFASIDIAPRPEDAVDGRVPVSVALTPAKRDVYTAGLSYGTDNGVGVRLGMERRYVNDRGHKLLGQIDWARKRKTATVQYRIPAFAWLDGWYALSAQYYDEQSDYIDTRKVELVGSRSGQVNDRLNAIASLHALRERWAYAESDDGDPATPVPYNYATFLYPALRGEYIDADDRIFPRDGIGATVEVRGGVEGVGSDASFLQAWSIARWYRGIGQRNRLLLRAEAGGTFTNALVDMPPSLRFYAGGDRSIRGYGFREVGPTTIGSDGKKYALGAKRVLTGTAEFEHYFDDTWGAAVFVDAGDAFDVTPDIHTGVGLGARWRSPVGPVRFDIAHGLKDPDSDYEIYLNIGADW
jgi:translocation and assembly module TamA